ncbi:GMC family oxidoreductase [Kineosporia succinea]|uniref:Choline dehydrogenase n=1 Tax=Kineosporia succinea TaxID=84632 RepID=A0ABT9PA55_9ACTN|nr:GMC family oxidoreductase N-terminal domain-containing protein [Kineosporia succinea]MDP9829573.1 choline dehydrogenase [Kineosporia succinea]
MSTDVSADVVVVGAGSAGCVLAARLSEDPGLRVTLIETGPGDVPEEVRIPAYGGLLMTGERAWASPTVPQTSAGGRVVPLVTGTGLGGGSSINSMGWLQAHPADYDQWAAAGADGWDAKTLVPLFARIEDHELGASGTHGSGGPMTISGPRHLHPLALPFVRAAREQGWPVSADLNGEQRTGVSLAASNVRDGRRHSVVDGYLTPAVLSRANLTVLTGTRVERVLLEGERAVGVAVRHETGSTRDILASAGVVVTAGALRTPQLLMLSGIGPAAHLAEHGIAVIRDLPAVGSYLQDHPAVAVPFVAGASVMTYPDARADYDLARRGPLSTLAQVAALVPSPVSGTGPDVPPELVFGLALLGAHSGLPAFEGPSGAWLVGLVDPDSRGTVRLASPDPGAEVVVDPRYLSEDNDRRRLREGTRAAFRMLTSDALNGLVQPLLPEPADDAALDAFIDATLATYFHPAGTARIGTDTATSVVDPGLRVHGLAGLWVADASVMPRITRTLPQATIVAVAERAAELVAASLGEVNRAD